MGEINNIDHLSPVETEIRTELGNISPLRSPTYEPCNPLRKEKIKERKSSRSCLLLLKKEDDTPSAELKKIGNETKEVHNGTADTKAQCKEEETKRIKTGKEREAKQSLEKRKLVERDLLQKTFHLLEIQN